MQWNTLHDNGVVMLWNNFYSLNYVSCDTVYGESKGDHILTDVLLGPVLCICIKIAVTCEHGSI